MSCLCHTSVIPLSYLCRTSVVLLSCLYIYIFNAEFTSTCENDVVRVYLWKLTKLLRRMNRYPMRFLYTRVIVMKTYIMTFLCNLWISSLPMKHIVKNSVAFASEFEICRKWFKYLTELYCATRMHTVMHSILV